MFHTTRLTASHILRVGHRHLSTDTNYYELLEVPHNASIKEIKGQFRKLSKKYHPDLHPNLSVEEKELNHARFVAIVLAYDTLKDIKKKKLYDHLLREKAPDGTIVKTTPRSEWHNKYYGEAKYYSKSGSNYSALGLNSKRHRVHNFSHQEETSTFSGKHVNYGDRYDVPHFNYEEHLLKHLKFEQRIINKHLTEADRAKIMAQLSKSGEKLSEELVTKHLMRHIHHSFNGDNAQPRATQLFASESRNGTNRNPHMYHGPGNMYNEDEEGGFVKVLCMLGGAGSSLYLLYSLIH